MARSRNIKPSFFTNDDLAEVDFAARLLFIGLWCIADREGRLIDRPKKIKAEILPYDTCDADVLLNQLSDRKFINRYVAGGEKYIQIINFTKHQDPHYKEKASEIPAPEGHCDSGKTAGGVPEKVRLSVFNRDGNQCKHCGSTNDLSLDHIVARSNGGSHDESNLQTLCRRCNSAKNNRQSKADLDQSLINDRPMIGQSSGSKSPLIPDSLFPLPSTLIPLTPPSPIGDVPPEKACTFPVWLERIKAEKQKPISSYQPVWNYARTVGIADDWIHIAWLKFLDRYTTDEKASRKRYKNWRGVFLRAIKDNWFNIWYVRDGNFILTTTGYQADIETREAS